MVYRKVFENINFIWGDVYNERWPGVKEGYPPPLSMVLACISSKKTKQNYYKKIRGGAANPIYGGGGGGKHIFSRQLNYLGKVETEQDHSHFTKLK